MATQDEDKGAHGRKYDQLTRDGTSSAGSMGVDGTGGPRRQGGSQGGRQADTRTDDLLSDGREGDKEGGFASGASAGELQAGMDGIGSRAGSGAGNRQSGIRPDGQSGAMNPAHGKDEPGGPQDDNQG